MDKGSDEGVAWIRDLYRDEIRSGFLVTAHRKRIWEIELMMLAELERVCEKYGLSYYADGGTLLGAVRHQGFIPWDDDIDVMMPRPDYEKLQEVGPTEFESPLFFQNVYTDGAFYHITKLRHSGTLGLEHPKMRNHQGIFLDIFPLDAVRDGSPRMEKVALIQMEMYLLSVQEELYRYLVAHGMKTYISTAVREALLQLPPKERYCEYERFQTEHFAESKRLNFFGFELEGRYPHIDRAWYSDTVRLPFEGKTIVAPVGYEPLLHELFGDYHQFVKFASDHNGDTLFSPDVPYTDYYAVLDAKGN